MVGYDKKRQATRPVSTLQVPYRWASWYLWGSPWSPLPPGSAGSGSSCRACPGFSPGFPEPAPPARQSQILYRDKKKEFIEIKKKSL